MNFDEAKELKLTDEEREAFKRLKDNKDWQVLRKVLESYILRLTYNLISGTEKERGGRALELERLSGMTYYWNKIVELIEKKHE